MVGAGCWRGFFYFCDRYGILLLSFFFIFVTNIIFIANCRWTFYFLFVAGVLFRAFRRGCNVGYCYWVPFSVFVISVICRIFRRDCGAGFCCRVSFFGNFMNKKFKYFVLILYFYIVLVVCWMYSGICGFGVFLFVNCVRGSYVNVW